MKRGILQKLIPGILATLAIALMIVGVQAARAQQSSSLFLPWAAEHRGADDDVSKLQLSHKNQEENPQDFALGENHFLTKGSSRLLDTVNAFASTIIDTSGNNALNIGYPTLSGIPAGPSADRLQVNGNVQVDYLADPNDPSTYYVCSDEYGQLQKCGVAGQQTEPSYDWGTSEWGSCIENSPTTYEYIPGDCVAVSGGVLNTTVSNISTQESLDWSGLVVGQNIADSNQACSLLSDSSNEICTSLKFTNGSCKFEAPGNPTMGSCSDLASYRNYEAICGPDGNGYRTRDVQCINTDTGQPVADENCTSTQPSDVWYDPQCSPVNVESSITTDSSYCYGTNDQYSGKQTVTITGPAGTSVNYQVYGYRGHADPQTQYSINGQTQSFSPQVQTIPGTVAIPSSGQLTLWVAACGGPESSCSASDGESYGKIDISGPVQTSISRLGPGLNCSDPCTPDNPQYPNCI